MFQTVGPVNLWVWINICWSQKISDTSIEGLTFEKLYWSYMKYSKNGAITHFVLWFREIINLINPRNNMDTTNQQNTIKIAPKIKKYQNSTKPNDCHQPTIRNAPLPWRKLCCSRAVLAGTQELHASHCKLNQCNATLKWTVEFLKFDFILLNTFASYS